MCACTCESIYLSVGVYRYRVLVPSCAVYVVVFACSIGVLRCAKKLAANQSNENFFSVIVVVHHFNIIITAIPTPPTLCIRNIRNAYGWLYVCLIAIRTFFLSALTVGTLKINLFLISLYMHKLLFFLFSFSCK